MLRFSSFMKIKYIFILFSAAAIASCARASVREPKPGMTLSFKAQIVENAPALKGKVVMQPFRPGEGVASNAVTDQASLMLVKGFTERLNQGSSDLLAVTDDSVSDAHFFIKGYVTQSEVPEGLMKRLRKKLSVFSAEGKMIDLSTERVIISFSVSAQSFERPSPSDLAYQVGARIAAYFIGQDKESP